MENHGTFLDMTKAIRAHMGFPGHTGRRRTTCTFIMGDIIKYMEVFLDNDDDTVKQWIYHEKSKPAVDSKADRSNW